MLDEGRYASISEMAAAERVERGYLGSLLRLTPLASDVVEAVLDGRQTDGPEMRRVLNPIPADWSGQRQALRGAAQRI